MTRRKKYFFALMICTKCGRPYLESACSHNDQLSPSYLFEQRCNSCGGKMRHVRPGERGLAREVPRLECPCCHSEQPAIPADPLLYVCRSCGYHALDLSKYLPYFKQWGKYRSSHGKFHLYKPGEMPAACGYNHSSPLPPDSPERLDQCCKHCLATVMDDGPEKRARLIRRQKGHRWCDVRCDHKDDCLIPCHISRVTGEKYPNYEEDHKRLCGF